MDSLTRLRSFPGYDSLTDDEVEAVIAASDLLEALRPSGFVFALEPNGALQVMPPAGDHDDVRVRVVALADAILFCLHDEREDAGPGGPPQDRPILWDGYLLFGPEARWDDAPAPLVGSTGPGGTVIANLGELKRQRAPFLGR